MPTGHHKQRVSFVCHAGICQISSGSLQYFRGLGKRTDIGSQKGIAWRLSARWRRYSAGTSLTAIPTLGRSFPAGFYGDLLRLVERSFQRIFDGVKCQAKCKRNSAQSPIIPVGNGNSKLCEAWRSSMPGLAQCSFQKIKLCQISGLIFRIILPFS